MPEVPPPTLRECSVSQRDFPLSFLSRWWSLPPPLLSFLRAWEAGSEDLGNFWEGWILEVGSGPGAAAVLFRGRLGLLGGAPSSFAAASSVPFAECISQKERLEQLVTSLEKQLDEKEQVLRDLRQAKDADRTQRENKMSSFELKGRHQEWGAKTTPSPRRDQESLKLQHQLVTEQLKGLFRQRGQCLQQAPLEKKPPGSQEQTPLAPQTSQGLLTAPESFRFPKSQPASMNIQYSKGEEQNLQEQLKEKTQIISTMASEIQDLKQKNENLMQAKLRFQQQIQDIRRLSKQQPESSSTELAVPRLHSWAAGLQSAQGSDNSLPSAQSDELVLSRLPSQKDLGPVLQEPERSTNAGTQQSSSTSDAICALVPALALQAGPSLSAPSVPSIKLSPRSVTSLQDSESEGALLSPQDPTLLSPRPFASPRPWSPFKSQGSPEPPED